MIYTLAGRAPQFEGDYYVAPNATLIGSVTLGAEASVWWNAVVRGDNETIRVGARTNIQDGSVLHADPGVPLTLGRGVTVGHMAMLHGCTIGNNVLIGIGAIVLNGAAIGENSLVGAGTLVPEGKSYPPGALIVGTPGRVIRELTGEEIARVREAADRYVQKAVLYRSSLAPA